MKNRVAREEQWKQEAKVKRVVEWRGERKASGDLLRHVVRQITPATLTNASYLTPRLKVDVETGAHGHPRRNKRAN